MAGPADTFHLTGDEDSDYEDSFQASRVFVQDTRPERTLRSNDVDESIDEKECDFLTMITAISDAYANGRYIKMRCLNDVESVQLGGGNDFKVSSAVLDLPVVSARDQRRLEIYHNKVIMKKLRKELTGLSMSRVDMATFVRELRVLNHLHGHDNIVQLRGVGWLYDFMEDERLTPCPKPILILEEAVGTLETIIDTSPDLSLRSEMYICKGIASGLLAVHQCGLSHGDVKPANILMFEETIVSEGVEFAQFRAKISDFSLTRMSSNTSHWSLGGTLGYIAPECDQQLSVTQLMLADVWSLGIKFARVLLRRDNFKPQQHETHNVDMKIMQLVSEQIEQSTWDPEIAALRRGLLFHTVQKAPELRDLNFVFVALQNFLGPTFDEDCSR
jgi:serine/threonine protein kinase